MKKYYIITLLVLTFSCLLSLAPEVSEIAITSDSENVLISYTLVADGQCQVVLVASDDAGATFRIYPTNLTGDVGNYVSPGDSKQITWNYTQDNIEAGDNFQIKLIARDNPYPAEDNNNFLSFSKVEGGTFHNGTADVTLSTFFMDKFETTQGEYEAVVGTNPSYHSGGSKPVESTSWFDALIYCNIRSLQEGLSPCYNYGNQGLDPYEWSVENLSASAFSFDFGANGYRLPTEMEWMFAAKGGNEQPPTGYNQWPGTDNTEDLGDYAWGSFNAGSETHPVASKFPNQLYLYDMAGNVTEWCWDAYDNYASDAQTDPIGPDTGLSRIIRGGDYGNDANSLNLTNRYSNSPFVNFLSIGFRSVRRMEESSLEVTPTPVVDTPPGTYNSAQEITISSGFGRSNIYYTLDGSYPDLNSTLYTTPITISDTTTVKARAYRDGYQPSEVLTAEYEITIMPENFILVESGTFHNGTGDITLSSFYMDKYEITQAEYESVVGTNPSSFIGDNNPVEQVSWFDAIKYCNLRSMQKGLTPCYNYNGEGTDPSSWSDGWNLVNNQVWYSCDFSADGYRLPTEMEWMYAAKGGKLTNKVTYNSWAGTDDFTELGDYAWYSSNATSTTHPVGTKEPNELGLYDMSGNVWEWCWDMYEEYNPEAQTNPEGSVSNVSRIYRGGSWLNGPINCKVTVRWRLDPPDESQNFLGFRVVRRLDTSVPEVTPTPSITPEAGSYSAEQTIELSANLSGTYRQVIYYTLDGSYPNLTSDQYRFPFTISDTTTVKAMAYIDGYQPSEVLTAEYQIETPLPEDFDYIEGGTFYNGTSDVTVSSFSLRKYELTQGEYEDLMGTNPAHDYGLGDNYPVYYVSWFDAIKYCNLRSMRDGLTPCYEYGDYGTDPADWEDFGWNTSTNHTLYTCDFSALGYRLPTEMEWLYAAKGGSQSSAIDFNQFAGTDNSSYLTFYAWYNMNSNNSTRPVGGKYANQLELYDMSGNIDEWCWDIYGAFSNEAQIDPTGSSTGNNRVNHGGSWNSNVAGCLIERRNSIEPSASSNVIGIRLARSIEASELEVTQNPVISPAPGSYEYGQRITIDLGEAYQQVYYTLDGSVPNLTSNYYSGFFSLSESVTIKARAYRYGQQPSEVVSSEYEIGELSNNFIYVEGGTFHNGTANITVSSFSMNKYELTEGEYEAFMGATPSHNYGDGADYPILLVSWVKALKYCNLRSNAEGLTPCYEYDDDGTNPDDWADGWNTFTNHTLFACNFSANGYRLPTEMEWMYAAKGGNLTPATGYGNYATDANYGGGYFDRDFYMWINTSNGAKPVGTKLPNYLGIHDMSGNVYELCWDIYGEYNSGSQTNPTGPTTGDDRIRRGGSWEYGYSESSVTEREPSINPTTNYVGTGFRLVRGTGISPDDITPNPVFSPEAGTYEGYQTISITCETDQAEIYYTLDGSNPDFNSTLYSEPFIISHATSVRARAYSDGYQPSGLVIADYVIIPENFIAVEGGSVHNGNNIAVVSDFYIGKYEVTQAEYEEVAGTNPSNYTGQNKPVEQVTWYDAVLYCNAKSTQEGLTPCYNTNTWECNFAANGYRLPTEMEWMYAAKGGTYDSFSGYDLYAGTNEESQLPNYAVYSGLSVKSRYGTEVVGGKIPNELGLYDMSGNVWEWCNDWYGEYSTSYQIDPVGPDSGEFRVLRGGAHLGGANSCLVRSRSQFLPSYSYYDTGFRLVRSID